MVFSRGGWGGPGPEGRPARDAAALVVAHLGVRGPSAEKPPVETTEDVRLRIAAEAARAEKVLPTEDVGGRVAPEAAGGRKDVASAEDVRLRVALHGST